MEKCHVPVEKQSQIRTINVLGFEWLGCGETQWGGVKAGAFVWTCNQNFLFTPVRKESLGHLNLLFQSISLIWYDCQPQINKKDTSSRMKMCGNAGLNWIISSIIWTQYWWVNCYLFLHQDHWWVKNKSIISFTFPISFDIKSMNLFLENVL